MRPQIIIKQNRLDIFRQKNRRRQSSLGSDYEGDGGDDREVVVEVELE